jgi:predicted DNA-binding WGR domain protein
MGIKIIILNNFNMPKFVDKQVPDRTKYKVVEEYATVLNQTNITDNNNKFYIIQLLVDNDDKYYVWTRWGRVGENGQNNIDEFDDVKKDAIEEYKKKFKTKTGNKWEKISSFEFKTGKYTLVEIESTEDTYTDKSEPIGKLSAAQIEKGQLVLKKIEQVLEKTDDIVEFKEPIKPKEKTKKKKDSVKDDIKDSVKDDIKDSVKDDIIDKNLNALADLSSQFFSLIPTVTGRKKPEPIITLFDVKQKEELLKFYLRMGFDEINNEADKGLTGIMDLVIMKTLEEAIGNCCSLSDIKSAVKKGHDLCKSCAGNPTISLDKELYGSIMLYTSNAIYKDLNKVLRDENRFGIKKYFNYLRMFFEAMSRLPKNEFTLWRGISVDLYSQYKVGNTITWWGISSCTADQQVAKNFMNGCGGNCTLLTIDTKTATDISSITFYSSEKESLLAPGTQLQVISSEKKGKITYIHMKEVGRIIQ